MRLSQKRVGVTGARAWAALDAGRVWGGVRGAPAPAARDAYVWAGVPDLASRVAGSRAAADRAKPTFSSDGPPPPLFVIARLPTTSVPAALIVVRGTNAKFHCSSAPQTTINHECSRINDSGHR
ncbi:hypothetical protein Voc01_024220 [Virgisporangium ochraceum]|uniref:Uncharacterized protein n=1 Tax=Virgisporangium ochraceum TaxID=65505 RepID=A0A8J3ZU24_9ACTN|nr:hypothetical protein Voc01_024220 [Virgisporangium ochraceum]